MYKQTAAFVFQRWWCAFGGRQMAPLWCPWSSGSSASADCSTSAIRLEFSSCQRLNDSIWRKGESFDNNHFVESCLSFGQRHISFKLTIAYSVGYWILYLEWTIPHGWVNLSFTRTIEMFFETDLCVCVVKCCIKRISIKSHSLLFSCKKKFHLVGIPYYLACSTAST